MELGYIVHEAQMTDYTEFDRKYADAERRYLEAIEDGRA